MQINETIKFLNKNIYIDHLQNGSTSSSFELYDDVGSVRSEAVVTSVKYPRDSRRSGETDLHSTNQKLSLLLRD
jgi:hypothetical protein